MFSDHWTFPMFHFLLILTNIRNTVENLYFLKPTYPGNQITQNPTTHTPPKKEKKKNLTPPLQSPSFLLGSFTPDQPDLGQLADISGPFGVVT